MPGEDIQSWSVTAANNGNADTSIVWSEGQTRASVNNSSRSEMAAHAKDRNLKNGSIVTGGSANAQTFTSGVGYIAPIPTGLIVKLKIGATLTNTATTTLNMDGIGATPILTDTGEQLRGGELTAGCYTDFLWDGTSWIFLYSREFFQDLINGGNGVIIGTQIFSTAGTFVYTPTATTECMIVECIGGGGGGGGNYNTAVNQVTGGGGGGSGGYSRRVLTAADVGVAQTVTIGAGGAGGTVNGYGGGGDGSNGADTTFGGLVIAKGGGGGKCADIRFQQGIAGVGGSTTGAVGDITAAGAPGGSGIYGNFTGANGLYVNAMGGSSAFGGGAAHSGGPTNGTDASNYGSGGSGGLGQGSLTNNMAGGAGSAGIIVITEFAGRGAPGRDGAAGAAGPIGPAGPSGAGTGDVLRSGIPTTGQVAQWTDASHIAGVDLSTLVPSDAFFTTGDAKLTFKTTADTGWVMMNDGSIGNASSSATTRANADTEDLFTLLYNNITALVVQSSAGATVARGASAAVDYAANRRLVLPAVLGRALAGAGAGSGLTARILGATAGEETHVQTVAELAAHAHTSTPDLFAGTNSTTSVTATGGPYYLPSSAMTTTVSAGSSSPMNVMQPTTFLNVMIKL